MNWKPKPWIAALLGFFLQPVGMLYVAKVKWAAFYFIASFAIFFMDTWVKGMFPNDPALKLFSFNYVLAIFAGIHAYIIAKRSDPISKRPWYSKWWGLILVPTLFFAIIFLVRAFLYEPFRIPAGSMSPTLVPGDHVIVEKWPYGNYGTNGVNLHKKVIDEVSEPERGDIIVFEYPVDQEISFVKRLIGMPGDSIKYDGGRLTINGKEVAKELISTTEQGGKTFLESLGKKPYNVMHTNPTSRSPRTY